MEAEVVVWFPVGTLHTALFFVDLLLGALPDSVR